MRKSVFAGLLACTLIFLGTSVKAEALSLEEIKNTTNQISAVEEIETITESEQETTQEEEVKKIEIKKHVVNENESLSDIAKAYNTTWKRIYDKNEVISDPNIISPGTEIIIPEENEVIKERPMPVQEIVVAESTVEEPIVRSQSPAPRVVSRGSSSGNGYVAGYCTWYVKNRRPDLPNNLGNAYAWFSNASAQGVGVGYEPRVGAAAQRNNHVGYVEAVHGDGTITISDMNYRGLYQITTRRVNASEWRYIY